MYRTKKNSRTSLKINDSYQGETIEEKLRRMIANKEPLKTPGIQLIYTERSEGVRPDMNPRTDRWELACEGMDAVTKSKLAKREARHKPPENPKLGNQADGGPESIQGT